MTEDELFARAERIDAMNAAHEPSLRWYEWPPAIIIGAIVVAVHFYGWIDLKLRKSGV